MVSAQPEARMENRKITEIRQNIAYWDIQSSALAGSLAGGLLLTLVLFYVGVPIASWHLGMFAGIYLAWGIVCKWRLTPRPIMVRAFEFFPWMLRFALPTVAIAAVGFVLNRNLHDLTVDSLSSYQEPVVALANSWNPILDPYFSEARNHSEQADAERLLGQVQRGVPLNFSFMYHAVATRALGNLQSSKGWNLLWIWLTFSYCMSFANRMGWAAVWRWLFSLVISLNPVVMYQLFTHYQDGPVSSLFVAIILLVMISASGHLNGLGRGAATSLGFILAGMKIVGLGYAIIGLGILGLIELLRCWRKNSLRTLSWGVLTLMCVLYAGDVSRLWILSEHFWGRFMYRLVLYTDPHDAIEVDALSAPSSSGDGLSESDAPEAQNVPPTKAQLEVVEPKRVRLSLASLLGPTRAQVQYPAWKSPFELNWQEFRLFRNMIPDPRSGGMGPMFNLMLLGALLVVGYTLVWQRRVPPVWYLAACLVCLLPLTFVPLHWARWIGHLWILPVLTAFALVNDQLRNAGVRLGVFSLQRMLLCIPRFLLVAVCAVGIFNSLLIGTVSGVGHYRASQVLEAQLDIIEQLDQPLTTYIGWSAASRFWLIDRGLHFHRDYLLGTPYIQLLRTETRVFVSEGEMDRIAADGDMTIRSQLQALRSTVSQEFGDGFGEDIFEVPGSESLNTQASVQAE